MPKTPTSAPTIDSIDQSHKIYLPTTGAPKAGDIVVIEGKAVRYKATTTVSADAKVFREQAIEFQLLDLTGAQIEELALIDEKVADAQRAMFTLLSDAPKPDIVAIAKELREDGTEVTPDLLKMIYEMRNDEAQQAFIQKQALKTNGAQTISAVNRAEEQAVQRCAEERLALLWDVPYETVQIIRDFPGAYSVVPGQGFMPAWLKRTSDLMEEITAFHTAVDA